MHKIICLLTFFFILSGSALQAQDEFPRDTIAQSALPDSLGVSTPLYAPFTRTFSPWGGMYSCIPTFYGAGPDAWLLHEGFNAQLSMNVTAGLGSHAPRGVGFGQDAAFMYAVPLTKRFSVAGGLYVSHMNWGGYDYKQVGIAGVAAFRLSEKVSLYAYGSKTLLSHDAPPYWSPFIDDDRLGGMLHVKFNDTFSMGVSIEHRSNPYGGFAPYDIP